MRLKQTTQGFTLVEIMIVIVILSIFGAMVGLSIGVGASRENMQRYEQLVDDLKYVRLLAVDEQSVLGLQFLPANSFRDASYKIVKLSDEALANSREQAKNSTDENNQKFGQFDGLSVDMSAGLTGMPDSDSSPNWALFSTSYEKGINRELTSTTQLRIEPLTEDNTITPSDNPIFTNTTSETPTIIWFGNGETTPVKVAMFIDNSQIGDAIYIDQLGRVTTNSAEAGL